MSLDPYLELLLLPFSAFYSVAAEREGDMQGRKHKNGKKRRLGMNERKMRGREGKRKNQLEERERDRFSYL